MEIRYCHLSYSKKKKLCEFFIAGTPARVAAELAKVNRNTVNLFYKKLRTIVSHFSEKESPFLEGEIEVDESYFGGKRKGRRGRGAAGKTPVFGLLKRKGKVYSQVIPDAKTKTLMPIIRNRIKPDSIIYTDGLNSYDALDTSGFHHKRINHSKEFVNRPTHINGIENCWNQTKRRMVLYNGIPKGNFGLFLKEGGFKFNNPGTRNQLRLLMKWVRMYRKQGLK